MAPVARRVQTAPAGGINFGDLDMYVAGGGLPEGNYALSFVVQMYEAKDSKGVSAGPARLGVMVTAHSLDDAAAQPRNQFYSMGSSADKSFAPNPDTGKGVVAIPGGPTTTLPNSTNWAYFLKSLYDSGLPKGIFTNDLSVLDGLHAHIQTIPEPEERKNFANANATAEVATKPRRENQTISIVSEIKDDGKPWEGTGGIPEGAPVVAAKPNGSGKAAAKPAAKPSVAQAPAGSPAVADEDVVNAAIQAASEVLEANPNGAARLLMRTQMFKSISASNGADVANSVVNTFFKDDAAVNGFFGQLGYVLKAGQIVPA